MNFDVTVFPDDWWQGIWWLTFQYPRLESPAAGDAGISEGHWMMLVRRLSRPDEQGRAAWCLEEAFQTDRAAPWRKIVSMRGFDGVAACIAAHVQQSVFAESFGGQRGWLGIAGDAAAFREALEEGARLPAWMSVRIIEHKPAAERSVAG